MCRWDDENSGKALLESYFKTNSRWGMINVCVKMLYIGNNRKIPTA